MPVFKDLDIADDKQHEQILKGIQPRHQNCFKVFKFCRYVALFSVGLALLILILNGAGLVIPDITKALNISIVKVILFMGIVAAIFGLGAVIVRFLFLRKAPFDDWVFEIAEKRLGTHVIFYDSKRIYIQYDRGGKEVDKREFVTEMSDKSVHYSYFYIKTFIDEGVIVVECTKRQPIPDIASFSPSDDQFWNILPLGLTINPVLQTVAPIGWYLNDQNKNDDMLDTVPSTSILICGGTGCYSENIPILMYDNLLKE